MKINALVAAVALTASASVMANNDSVQIQYIASNNQALALNIIQDTTVGLDATGAGSINFCIATTAASAPAAYSIAFDSNNSMALANGGNSMSYTAALVDADTTANLALSDGGTEMDESEVTMTTGAPSLDCNTSDYQIDFDADETAAIAGLTYTDTINLTVSAD